MYRNNMIVVLILLIWFVISFVSNIIGPLMPSLIETYELNLTLAAFLPFSFFLAYAIVSIPSGLLIESIGSKKAMLIAFSFNFSGVLLFALFPVYLIALVSLFIIGIGMAMLQVIINPLMRTSGGEENFAFFSVMGQLVFGLASFVSPLVFSYFMLALPEAGGDNASAFVNFLSVITPDDKPWLALYWLFSVAFIVLITMVLRSTIPRITLETNEKNAGWAVCLNLMKKRTVVLYFIGIVAYVGSEQGLANFMSEFLRQYHDISPEKEGAVIISWFWGLMSVGCLVGLILLKLLDSTLILRLFSFSALIGVACALYGPTDIALIAFPLTGFLISVMFSIIFSLGLNSVREHHGSFSGILCTGIFGGALVPLLIGILGDWLGLRAGMGVLFVTLGYIFIIGFWAKPLITNKTIFLQRSQSK